jgi:hypothetical protein
VIRQAASILVENTPANFSAAVTDANVIVSGESIGHFRGDRTTAWTSDENSSTSAVKTVGLENEYGKKRTYDKVLACFFYQKLLKLKMKTPEERPR